jgi:hypothetical protein
MKIWLGPNMRGSSMPYKDGYLVKEVTHETRPVDQPRREIATGEGL